MQPQSSELMMAMDKPIFGTSVDYSASLEDMLVQADSLNSEGQFIFAQSNEDAGNYCEEKSGTVSDENIREGQEHLNKLLDSYSDRFNLEDFTPANVAPIHVPLRPEYKDRVFYRPEPMRSVQDQQSIDDNARKLLSRRWAKMNPKSRHNISQVAVKRFDKKRGAYTR